MAVDLVAALRRGQIFQSLSEEPLGALARSSRMTRYAAGQLIFSTGDASDALYVLLSGRVRVYRTTSDGEEITIATLSAGDILGEMAVLDGRGRSADAQAIDDVDAARISSSSFFAFISDNPDVAITLMTVLTRRLRDTLEQVETIAFQGLEERVARLLLKLVQTHGAPTPDGVRIDLRLSHRDLGLFIATSRESVGKQLRAFKDSGAITVKGGYLIVTDQSALEEICGDDL